MDLYIFDKMRLSFIIIKSLPLLFILYVKFIKIDN